MELIQAIRAIFAGLGSGVNTLLPGNSGFRMCVLTSLISALCYVFQKLGGDLGITCEDRNESSAKFTESLCSNLASLLVPYRCWADPDRVQMKADKYDPSMFGSHRCHSANSDHLNEWFEYWQHDWTTLYFVVLSLLLSTPKLLWKAWERGLMAGIVGRGEDKLVMRNGEESNNVTRHLVDFVGEPGLARAYVAKYVGALTYGLLLQVFLFYLTVAFLPANLFLTYGTDAAAWSQDPSAAAALHYGRFSDDELRAANGSLPSFLLLFPPAALCPVTYSGSSGTPQNREIRCAINNSRFAAPAYFVLWWAFVINTLEKGLTLLKLALALAYYPTGWAVRRISMAWMLRGTALEGRNLKGLLYELTFSQFVMFGLLYDVMDGQAFADQMRHAHTQLEV